MASKPQKSAGIRRLVPVPHPPSAEHGVEHRGFPRRPMELVVGLRQGPAGAPSFAATLRSDNVSMSGIFLRSTYFLPVGTLFDLSFRLPAEEQPVAVRARLVRHQDGDGSGLGLEFEEFSGQSEIAMARLFLDEKVRDFAERYLGSGRAKSLKSEGARLVDALAAWELEKVTHEVDPWAP